MDDYLRVFLSRSFFPYCLGENGYIIQITSWKIFECPHEVREYHCKKLQTNHINLSSTLVSAQIKYQECNFCFKT